MKNRYAALAIVFASLAASSAMAATQIPQWGAVQSDAQAGLSAQEVKAQTLQAIRSGEIIATGELAQPSRSAAMPMAATVRSQARMGATPHGQMMAGGDAATRMY